MYFYYPFGLIFKPGVYKYTTSVVRMRKIRLVCPLSNRCARVSSRMLSAARASKIVKRGSGCRTGYNIERGSA